MLDRPTNHSVQGGDHSKPPGESAAAEPEPPNDVVDLSSSVPATNEGAGLATEGKSKPGDTSSLVEAEGGVGVKPSSPATGLGRTERHADDLDGEAAGADR